MLAEKKDLAINKGNDVKFNVQFTNQNNQIIIFEKEAIIYFTVKEDFCSKNFLFQKTSLNGITYNAEKQIYTIKISSDDTEYLEYKDYAYDITVVRNGGQDLDDFKEKTTVLMGTLKIGKVTTFKENEVEI